MQLKVLNSNVEFSGRRRKHITDEVPKRGPLVIVNNAIEQGKDSPLFPKSLKLMRALDLQIENDWSDIKAGNKLSSSPRYHFSLPKNEFVTIKPIYGAHKPLILMELEKGEYCQKFLFDRANPNKFRYEKTVTTDYGSATLKTFNSETQHDANIEALANEKILTVIPKILEQKPLETYFGRPSKIRRDGIDIDI